jgi:phosphatidylserine/phosphatidylglycerophosphate/cardiolipin synthase-like enzyme
MNAIQTSQKSIDVLMYSMSDPNELSALKDAAKRGVKVRVVLSPSKRIYNSEAVSELQKAGIDVRWFNLAPGMKEMHAKVAVFDGQTVVGGSTNWVHSSNKDNHELGIWMQGAVAGQVERNFDEIWTGQSTEAHQSSVNQLEAHLMDGVARFL